MATRNIGRKNGLPENKREQLEYPLIAEVERLEAIHYRSGSATTLAEIQQLYATCPKRKVERGRLAVLLSIYLQRENPQQAADYLSEARKIAERHRYPHIQADVCHADALAMYAIGDLRQMVTLEERALLLARQCGYSFMEAVSLWMLGTVASLYGAYEASIEQLSAAYELAKDHNFDLIRVKIAFELGELLLLANDPQKASNLLNEALHVAESLEARNQIQSIRIRLATTELELGHHQAVEQLIREVRAQHDPLPAAVVTTLHTLQARVRMSQARWQDAIKELAIASRLARKANSERVRSNIHGHLADLYLKTKQLRPALAQALASLKDAETSQDMYCRKEALRRVHDAYKALGNYKQAHHYLERYNDLVAESDTALLKNRLEYHALKSEFEKERALSAEKTRQSELLRIELEHKERELTEKTKHLIKQTDALVQFRDDLRAIIRRTPADDPMVKQIKERIRDLPESQLSWQDFDKQFSEVHPEFLSKLDTRFPKLTPMERKICALLRLNLTSPDIAKLIFLSERNIQNHRYRLRKKLCLSTDANLHEFLAKI